MTPEPKLTLATITGKAQVASALSTMEANPGDRAIAALLDEAFEAPKGIAIGVTGPPGAGKSTLINAMIAEWRKSGETVAVLAVDPSSKASGGALLGDRVRMRTDPSDNGVFIRSMAARGRLGGLSSAAYPASVLLRALYDKVIIESVGVGQSETDIATVSDSIILCIQPASGDSLQFMKAGIAEIPDIAVVTKADLGAAATRALADLKGALSLAVREPGAWETECLSISVTAGKGALCQLFAAIAHHESWLREHNRLSDSRQTKARAWVGSEILAQFGQMGLSAVIQELFLEQFHKPFATARQFTGELYVARKEPANR